jgi:hypothetical protein
MTRSEAKRILELCRPCDRRSTDPEVREALDLVRQDPELKQWFDQQTRVEEVLREKFRSIAVPEGLRERLLAQQKIVRPRFTFGTTQWLQLAACLVVLIGVVVGLTQYGLRSREPKFSQFESRMVRSALREYKMEILTDDMGKLRGWMEARNAPANFQVPEGLAKLKLTGGGVLHWQNHPVSMACFDRGDKQMLFLFVMDKNVLADPPAGAPQTDQIKKLATVAWSDADKTYLLAGPTDEQSLRKYLSGPQTL